MKKISKIRIIKKINKIKIKMKNLNLLKNGKKEEE